ncbi:hypothetical protein Vafri_11760, partial [Volvox africanus]
AEAAAGAGLQVPIETSMAAAPGVPAALAAAFSGNGDDNSIGSGGGRRGSGVLLPVSRRKLLLGVPGPLCAVSLGPYGSVLVTSEAGLALSCSPHMKQMPCGVISASGGAVREEGQPPQQGRHQQPQQQHTQQVQKTRRQQQQDQQLVQEDQKAEMIDLRGTWGMAAGDCSPVRPITRNPPHPPFQGADVKIAALPSLFNISARLNLDDGEDCGNDRVAASSGGVGDGVRTMWDTSGSGAAVPKQLQLEQEGKVLAAPPKVVGEYPQSSASGYSASLCVVWPGRVGPGPIQADLDLLADSSSESHAGPGGGFCSLAPLQLQRPDLLSYCGALVLAASSVGPPLIATFRLAPFGGGLTLLSYLTPAWSSETICASRGRLRGLAAVLAAPPGGAAAAGGEGKGQCQPENWGTEYDSKGATGLTGSATGHGQVPLQPEATRGRVGGGGGGAEAILVVVVGEVESPPAGSGIFGFNRSGRPLGQKVAQLVASAHPLPPAAATAATATTAATANTIATSNTAAVAEDTEAAATASQKGQSASEVIRGPAPSVPRQADAVIELWETCRDGCAIGAKSCVVAAEERTETAATVAVSASATAGPTFEAVARAMSSQFTELLADFRRHLDQRLDALAGSLEAQAIRLSRIEAALKGRNQRGEEEDA